MEPTRSPGVLLQALRHLSDFNPHTLLGHFGKSARAAIKEMHRRVGDLTFDDRGLAKRGLLVRHLVMPGPLDGTREIMCFLATEVSRHTYVNVMDQYYPAGRANAETYSEINRRITPRELTEALAVARPAGLHRFDFRWANRPSARAQAV